MKRARNDKKGVLVWITGLPGSGKTTLAKTLHGLMKNNIPSVLVDGDAVREIMGHDLGYNIKDRLANAYRIVKLNKLLTDHGLVVLCPTVSLFSEIHRWNKNNIENLIEIFIDVPMEVLISRDQKGMYSAAVRGKKKNVRGINQKFDVPKKPHFTIRNHGDLDSFLKNAGMIKKMILRKMKS